MSAAIIPPTDGFSQPIGPAVFPVTGGHWPKLGDGVRHYFDGDPFYFDGVRHYLDGSPNYANGDVKYLYGGQKYLNGSAYY